MREILFRGKNYDGDWEQGSLHTEYGETTQDGKREIDYRILGMRGECRYVIPETVGQYTGLTDKNGTKVFEGDIIKVECAGNNRGIEGTVAKVVFEKCKFALVWGWHNEIVCLTDFCNVTFEVISNIHDNPELLESEVQGE